MSRGRVPRSSYRRASDDNERKTGQNKIIGCHVSSTASADAIVQRKEMVRAVTKPLALTFKRQY
jgi:hypothetical protein